jgi:hypothetical protein
MYLLRIYTFNGDWGLGLGGWGLGSWPHPPIPNPQSPIPNPHVKIYYELYLLKKIFIEII